MRPIQSKATFRSLIKAGLAASALIMASGAALAQSVDLTAAATIAALPDGQQVPMWGYSCSTTTPVVQATCASMNPNAGTTAGVPNWSPVVITVPPGPLT